MTFLSLKNSPISSNHQNVHQNWWKFNRKFKSPKHSPKLVKILAKIHWKMNVVSYLWDHIDFLQNCHQFWWFSSIFANFCDFFIEIYSDSLKFSPKLVTKKTQNQKKLFSPEMVIFLSLKNSPISSNHQNFHQNWWQKKTKLEGIIVTRIGDIFVTQKLTNFFNSPNISPKLVKNLAKIQ